MALRPSVFETDLYTNFNTAARRNRRRSQSDWHRPYRFVVTPSKMLRILIMMQLYRR